MTEEFEYVQISTNSDGYALVEVRFKDRKEAVEVYLQTLEELANSDIAYPIPNEFETKASNENTKFIPTVTVKGRGPEVVTKYLEELERMKIV
jgi:hypothetical protein